MDDAQPEGPSLDDAVAAAEFRTSLRHFLHASERVARRAGLTPQRYQLLLMIKGAPDRSEQSTVGDLSRRLQLAQSTVTELVQRAEESGLIERRRHNVDARTTMLRLTAEGEHRLTQALGELAAERHRLAETIAELGL